MIFFLYYMYTLYSILVCTGIFKLFSNFILAGGLAVDLSFLSYQSISVFLSYSSVTKNKNL